VGELLAFVLVDMASELANHPEVVHVDGVLVDVLKQTELTVLEGKLKTIFEVLVCINNSSLLALPLQGLEVYGAQRQP